MSQLHSLSSDEIQSLHPLLKNLHERSDEVVKSWYRLYANQMGEGRALSEDEFSGIMSPLVRRSTTALLSDDMAEFERLARELGERLAKRGVSFFEVILSLHFCQESIETAHAAELSCTRECGFAKLCHTHATLVADGKITLNKGRIKNFDFSDLTTSAAIDHRVWRLTNLRARSAGGEIQGVTTIFDKPDTLEIVADPKINDVPIQSFLNWFNLSTTEMSGKVRLTGKLETVGNNDTERKRNLNGAFNLKIEDGTIHRMRIVVQLLNLLDLSRWFTFQIPDLTKQGIRFRAITADFKVTNGIYSTDNLIVDSSDLRMTGAGKIDVPKDELDFVVAVRPFAGIDAAISYIPLLGRSIAAIKNSFLVASFNITGRIDEPTITPAPLGTVSEWFWGVLGIPKNIIGFGESEKKEPTQPATEAPPP